MKNQIIVTKMVLHVLAIDLQNVVDVTNASTNL